MQRETVQNALLMGHCDHVSPSELAALWNDVNRLREQCKSARELLTNVEASRGSSHLPGLLMRAIRCFLDDAS